MRQVLIQICCGNCSQMIREDVLTEDTGIPVSFIIRNNRKCPKCKREDFYWIFLPHSNDGDMTGIKLD